MQSNSALAILRLSSNCRAEDAMMTYRASHIRSSERCEPDLAPRSWMSNKACFAKACGPMLLALAGADWAHQRRSRGPSVAPAIVHKAIVPPYHKATNGS